MRILSRLADAYRRWRHTRGFGVHSPFAYAIVTEALYPRRGYAYYLENDSRLESPLPGESGRARALYRLCIFLRQRHASPLKVHLMPEAPRCYRMAVRLAGAVIARNPDEAHCRVVRTESYRRECSQAPLHGQLMFSGREITILVSGRDMAPTAYTLS